MIVYSWVAAVASRSGEYLCPVVPVHSFRAAGSDQVQLQLEIEHNMSDWDAIVIGSGAGGLGGAVALSNLGQKVLVLEQHYLPGGWCHTFALEGHKFSPGVHYIGQLQEGGRMRSLLEGLGVGGDMEFMELNPDGFDHIVFEDETFDVPCGQEKFQQRLIERFPDERSGIMSYFRLMKNVDKGLTLAMTAKGLWGKIRLLLQAPSFVFSGMKPLAEIVGRYIRDPKLKAILESRAGDHGMAPTEVPFLQHVAIDCHYWDGAWFPRGGGGAIPRAFISRLKKNGSEIRTRTTVERILIEGEGDDRRAVGVRLADGEEIRSNVVISNADVWVTYNKLVGKENISENLAKRVNRLKPSVSALSLFMAADIDVDALGLDSGNYWILIDPDVSETYRQAEVPDLSDDGPFPGGFLTITTKKDPSKMHAGLHSMEAFVFVSYDAFKKWADSQYGDRPGDYEAFKEHLTKRMLDTVEVVIPGLRDHLKLCELGTPLTNDFYVAAHRGNLYGQAKSLSQIGPGAPRIRTEIPGLYHCGQSTSSHGVLGALATGVFAAAKITRKSVDDLLQFNDGGTVVCHSAASVSAMQPEAAPVG